MVDSLCAELSHLLPSELHLNVGIHQVLVVPYEGLLHVGHDAGVHPRQPFGPVDLQVVTSPRALRRDPLWKQQVTAARGRLGLENYNLHKP